MQTPRVRIAPSPTGVPHVGTAYIALFNYAFAKKFGGDFILRMEDTDQDRSKKEYEQQILKSLFDLGLTWSEGPDIGGPHQPYRQSERTEIYQQYAQSLLDAGFAYKCWCSPNRLQSIRETQQALQETGTKVRLGYDKNCLHLSAEEKASLEASNLPYVIRFNIPDEGKTTFIDHIRGEISWNNLELDDKVLLKSDGFPTYHLANVVDDHLMGITHVLRAEEWIPSTPLHLLLYQSFGWQPPVFCHMPLLRHSDGSKISKRKNPVGLNFYQNMGILPEALLNFLALQGYSMPSDVLTKGSEYFTLQTFIDHFELNKIKPSGPVFNLDKLRTINSEHIHQLDPTIFKKRILQYTEQWIDRIGPMLQSRMNLLSDWSENSIFYPSWEIQLTKDSFNLPLKRIESNILANALKSFLELIREIQPDLWNSEKIEEAAHQIQEKYEWSSRKDKTAFMQGIRIAVCGRPHTPGLGETLAAIEQYAVLNRLEKAINLLLVP